MGLRERLIEIRDALGSNAELARAAGTSRGNVTQWIEGDIKALKAITALTLQEKTGFSARWLILGRGQKKLSGAGISASVKTSDEKRSETESDSQKLLEIIRIFQETDQLGKDSIWAGVQRASKRIAKYAKPRSRTTSAIRR